MKKLIMSLVVVATAVMITGCESKEVKEYKAVLDEIVEVNKRAGVTVPGGEIDKAVEEFKSASADQQKSMLESARHKLERNKAGKGIRRSY